MCTDSGTGADELSAARAPPETGTGGVAVHTLTTSLLATPEWDSTRLRRTLTKSGMALAALPHKALR